jgi:hypothetical protein
MNAIDGVTVLVMHERLARSTRREDQPLIVDAHRSFILTNVILSVVTSPSSIFSSS